MQYYMKKGLIFELKRKSIHLLSLIFVAIYIFFLKYYGEQSGLIVLTLMLVLFLLLEFFRVQLKKKIPIIHGLWRSKEKNRMGGQVYLIAGMIIAFAVFDFRIALAVFLMVIFGDMAAAIIGIRFGKHPMFGMKNRDWEGFAAEFIVDFAIGLFLLNNFYIILAMALTATFVERMFTFADDNLLVPVIAGFVGQVLYFIL